MKRIQRKRAKGWRMPENAIYVGRGTVYGNPWRVGEWQLTAQDAVRFYREWLGPDGVAFYPDLAERRQQLLSRLDALRGHDLACWCALDSPCHADVLIELLNGEPHDLRLLHK